MDELIQDFISETFETLDKLSGELVAWEADPSDRERLDNIFRFFHTVKGSCGFLSLPRFERLSHAAEDVLSKLRDGAITPGPQIVTAILAIIDRIAALANALESGDAMPEADDSHLLDQLRNACSETEASLDPAPAMAPTGEAPADAHTPLRAVRIPLELLDHLMNGVSDMVLARNEVARRMRDADNPASTDAAFERLSSCIADMRDMIGKTRMQRIERVFTPLPRLVRDLNGELGKSVLLETVGAGTEMDREMIDMIRDPLMHIIRNAIDHGIESPHERARANKPADGKLKIEARQSGNQILIEISDDGRGIDVDALTSRAIASKVLRASEVAHMSEAAKLNLVFSPGLSTAKKVTSVSGRGVGMDVVHSNITRIGGTIDLENDQGAGLKIILRVPLTLTIIACLTIEAGGNLFALPRNAIQEILHAENENVTIESIGGGEIAVIRGVKIPHIALEQVLGQSITRDIRGSDRTIIAIDAGSQQKYALSVANVLDHEELVIRPGAPLIMENGLYAGTTLPDNGRPMLLLDPSGLAVQLKLRSKQDMKASGDAHHTGPRKKLASALVFHDFEGKHRAIRLGVIERVEDISSARVAITAGQMRLSVDDATLPIYGLKAIPENTFIKTLLLSDGAVSLYYAIDEVVDIFELSGKLEKAMQPGVVAGVTMMGDRQVEIIDTHWLFAQYCEGIRRAPPEAQPTCCIVGGDDIWTQNILAPLVEAAGYEIVRGQEHYADADIFISMQGEDQEDFVMPPRKTMISLAYDPAGAGGKNAAIYRYDRKALMHALETGLSERIRA